MIIMDKLSAALSYAVGMLLPPQRPQPGLQGIDYGVGHTCLLIVGSVPAYTSNQHLQYCHKNLHQCSPVTASRFALDVTPNGAWLAHCGCKHTALRMEDSD
jgi:hypothetical protein